MESIALYIKEENDPLFQKGLNLGVEQGIEQGVAKGIEQGIEQGIEMSVKKMLAKGYTIPVIADLLDLSEEEILHYID